MGPALDTIPIGTGVIVTLDSEPASAGPSLVRTARVDRVSEGLYALTVHLLAYDSNHPLARRRARLWLERAGVTAPPQESLPGVIGPASVVTPWGFVDLY